MNNKCDTLSGKLHALGLAAMLIAASNSPSSGFAKEIFQEPPLEHPFALDFPHEIEFPFCINNTRKIWIELGFLFANKIERSKASEEAGAASDICMLRKKCGIETQFQIRITRANGDSAYENISNAVGTVAFSADRYFRRLDAVSLPPGKYRMKVALLRSDRQPTSRTQISVRYDARAAGRRAHLISPCR